MVDKFVPHIRRHRRRYLVGRGVNTPCVCVQPTTSFRMCNFIHVRQNEFVFIGNECMSSTRVSVTNNNECDGNWGLRLRPITLAPVLQHSFNVIVVQAIFRCADFGIDLPSHAHPTLNRVRHLTCRPYRRHRYRSPVVHVISSI